MLNLLRGMGKAYKEAQKAKDIAQEDVYYDRLDTANHLADQCKSNIQQIFNDTFGG